MAKLHFVNRARRARREHGIKRGQSYWWWAFYRLGKRYSLTRPRPSQLTRSEFLGAVLGAQESIEVCLKLLVNYDEFSENGDGESEFEEGRNGLVEAIQSAVDAIQGQLDICSERADNVAERFPNGCPSLELLRGRIEQCERLLEELDATAEGVEAAETVADVEAAVEGIGWEVS